MRPAELSQKSEYPEISFSTEFSIGFPKILAKTKEAKCLVSRKDALEKIGIFKDLCCDREESIGSMRNHQSKV